MAAHIAKSCKPDVRLVIVVSAMGKTTERLFRLAHEITEAPSQRELDMLLTAGERISMSLLSLCLQKHGIGSISFTGSQSGIITDTRHGNAKIVSVKAFRILDELERGRVVIVAGFQGVSTLKEVTTLGRGGSDTTAVALACYLDADQCEIFTDVEGVFTADPRLLSEAHKFDRIDYTTMLNLAYAGARVLHPRAVEFAMSQDRPLEVRSSWSFAPGTIVSQEADMEQRIITALALRENLFSRRVSTSPEKLSGTLDKIVSADIELFHYDFQLSENGKFMILDLMVEEKSIKGLHKIAGDDFLIDTGSEDVWNDQEGFSALTLTGLRTWNDLGLLAEITDLLQDAGCIPKRIDHSYTSITLYFRQGDGKRAQELIHKKYIAGAYERS